MNYQEARKKLEATKPRENYLVIETRYDTKIVLPYEDGMKFMSALSKAELLKDGYGDPKHILPFNSEALKSYVLSAREYQRYKIAALLGVKADDLEAMEKEEAT